MKYARFLAPVVLWLTVVMTARAVDRDEGLEAMPHTNGG